MDIKTIDKNMQDSQKGEQANVKYLNLNNEYLRGVAFHNGFNRLDKDDFVSENVKALQKHTSGVNITFTTNSSFIKIKARLDGASYMAHMTAVGQIGFDLYVKIKNKWIFISTTKINKAEYEVMLLDKLPKESREYRLYFPLYMGVNEAKLGIEDSATITFFKPKQEKVVIYGTSISQGGCATRPGMSYTNILDRMLDYEFINLGFSGSAHLELEMAEILNRIDAKYLILEVEANNTKEGLMRKLPPFLETLITPNIILISHFPLPKALIDHNLEQDLSELRAFQKQMPKVTFVDGAKMLQDLGYEETVDGTHLTDLGFYMLAQRLKPYLE